MRMKITLSENLKENFQYSGYDGDDRYPALVAIQKPLDPSLLSILTVAANASTSAALPLLFLFVVTSGQYQEDSLLRTRTRTRLEPTFSL